MSSAADKLCTSTDPYQDREIIGPDLNPKHLSHSDSVPQIIFSKS